MICSLVSLLFIFCGSDFVDAGKVSTFDYCECRIDPWQSWSKCSSECGGGTQTRERTIHIANKPGCTEFTDCLTAGSGHEYRKCNENCKNGGTYSFYCDCPLRWKGKCCDEEVKCGNPGPVSHGRVLGHNYYAGSTVTYVCDNKFNLTQGDMRQSCSKYGYWSGRKPRCLFAHTCQSNPCQNGGSCIDGLERYDCKCPQGWSGVNCEIDVQPPILNGCPGNIVRHIATPTIMVNWTEPSFRDPMNTRLEISKNYPKNTWEFHWGDFTVQYSATKTRNGLRAECIFNITVRPFPCNQSLSASDHGLKACTGWKTDYGQYCLGYCDRSFSLMDENDYDRWYVCGASGVWRPSPALSKCERPISHSISTTRIQNHFNSCNDVTSINQIKTNFINRLNASQFSYFCHNFEQECTEKNVAIVCT